MVEVRFIFGASFSQSRNGNYLLILFCRAQSFDTMGSEVERIVKRQIPSRALSALGEEAPLIDGGCGFVPV